MSWKQIAIAKDIPSFSDASKPEPIANPSGKLCIARPMLTIIPVFNKLFLILSFLFDFVKFDWSINLLNFLSTRLSQIIIMIIPIVIPSSTVESDAIASASGISSKHTIAIISPDANDRIKLKNLLDVFFNITPIIPPIVVPKVPKNNPIRVVFKIAFNKITSLLFFLLLYLFYFVLYHMHV